MYVEGAGENAILCLENQELKKPPYDATYKSNTNTNWKILHGKGVFTNTMETCKGMDKRQGANLFQSSMLQVYNIGHY